MVINNSGGVMLRLSVTNILWIALVAVSWHLGWLQYLFVKDFTFISHGIAAATGLVILLSLWKGFTLSRILRAPEAMKEAYESKCAGKHDSVVSDVREGLKTRLMNYISFVEYFATTALAVGVLGTVIGLIIGFQHVDPSALSNVENAGATVAELLKGLSVAFHTTLVGGIANLWLRTNHFMLMQANAGIYAEVMEG